MNIDPKCVNYEAGLSSCAGSRLVLSHICTLYNVTVLVDVNIRTDTRSFHTIHAS